MLFRVFDFFSLWRRVKLGFQHPQQLRAHFFVRSSHVLVFISVKGVFACVGVRVRVAGEVRGGLGPGSGLDLGASEGEG